MILCLAPAVLLPDLAWLGWAHRVTVEERDGDEHCSALRLTAQVLEALPEAEGKEDLHPERQAVHDQALGGAGAGFCTRAAGL